MRCGEPAVGAAEVEHRERLTAFEPAQQPLVRRVEPLRLLELVGGGRERELTGAEAHLVRAVANDVA